MLICLALGACAAATNEGAIANYDALAKAQAACAARGGELRLRNNGNPEVLSDFACHRK